jgi:hypothetical protein
MKKLAVSALLSTILILMSAVAMANDVVVTDDSSGTQGWVLVPGFAPFNLYVIGRDIGEVVGWEIGMEISPLYTVLDRSVNHGPVILPPSEPDNYVIGLGGCFGTPGQDYLFITYNLGYFLGPVPPLDETFCLIPPTVGGASGFLAYVDCAAQIHEMTTVNFSCNAALTGCAILNPSCVLPTERRSWSALKAAY